MAAIFITAMAMQIPQLNVTSQIKMFVFVSWAAYGILPTLHWAIAMGGFKNHMVAVSILSISFKFGINWNIEFHFYLNLSVLTV